MEIELAVLSNLEPSVMPSIEGRRVVERYHGSSDSIIQQKVRKLVEGFEAFTRQELKKDNNRISQDISLNLKNFKFEYDQNEGDGGSVEILYISNTLLVKDVTKTIQDWFSYFIDALKKVNIKIHSKSASYYSGFNDSQIKSIRMSLNAIRKMAIENENLNIFTYGDFDGSCLSDVIDSSPELTDDKEKYVDEKTSNDAVNKEPDDNSDSNIDNPESTVVSQDRKIYIFDTTKAPPAYTPDITPEEVEMNNASISAIDGTNLSITLKKSQGAALVEVRFNSASDFNNFFDEYPQAPKRDCLYFDLQYFKSSENKNMIMNIKKAVIDNPYSEFLSND